MASAESTDILKINEIIHQYDDGKHGCCDSPACCPFKTILNIIRGTAGFLSLIFVLITCAFIIFFVAIKYILCCACFRDPQTRPFKQFFRKCLGNSRLCLETYRSSNWIVKIITCWYPHDLFIGFFQILEWVSFSMPRQYSALHTIYRELYNGPYPFLYGIAITDREQCLARMTNPDQIRDHHFGQFAITRKGSTRYVFPHSLDSKDRNHIMARGIALHFGAHPYQDIDDDDLYDGIVDEKTCELVWNQAMFYRCFGVRMTNEEVTRYTGQKRRGALFLLPRPFHFLLCGGYCLRSGEDIKDYITSLVLEKKSPRLVFLSEYAINNGYDLSQVIRAAVFVYMFAGGALAQIQHAKLLAEDQVQKEMCREDPHRWVLERLRLDTVIPMTSDLLTKEVDLEVGGTKYKFPSGVSVASSLTTLLVDPEMYPNPMEMNLNRDMSENVIFNGVYDEFTDVSRPPRGCPAMKLGMEVLVNVTGRFVNQ